MKKISAIFLLIFLLGLFFLTGRNSSFDMEFEDDVRIIVATDLHYLAKRCNDGGEYFMKMVEASDGKSTEYCEEIEDAFLDEVIVKNPDALVLSGDITFNGEKYSHQELAEKLKKVKDSGIRVLVLPGNHDLYNERAYAFSGKYIYVVENVDDKTFEEIYRGYSIEGGGKLLSLYEKYGCNLNLSGHI